MSAVLDWKPQPAFADYFLTNAREIIKQRTVFRPEMTYFVADGGRGSGKTFTFIDAVVVEASIRPVRILCTRELQNSIEESIKAEIEAAIIQRGLQRFFRILKTEITGLNGSKFIFKGIKNNINNLKSISDVDVVICEEAESITKNSWEKLLPSIRPRKHFEGREKRPINIIIFNPDDELDDTYQRFVINPPPRTITKTINWSDNKYFPPNLNEMRLHSLKTRPKKDHDHDWEGKPRSANTDVIIDRDWIRAARFASKTAGFKQVGIKSVAYDPAGQGRDSNAVAVADGNIINIIDDWVTSIDLREASQRAYKHSVTTGADRFVYDTCGGLGDGVAVFIDDHKALIIDEIKVQKNRNSQQRREDAAEIKTEKDRVIFPFDAGGAVANADQLIPGTKKTWGDRCSNAKAQAHMIVAQLFYNTYRYVNLGHKDIDFDQMISIDIDNDDLFNQIVRELSAPLWVKSSTNMECKQIAAKRT